MINRRVFGKALGVGTGAAAVSLTGLQGPRTASAAPAAAGSASLATFPQLKQVRAGLLNVGYAELGPAHGPAVIAEQTWWYQYYFATERGRLAMEDRTLRHDLTRLVWDAVSPTWDFDDATFKRTAAAFDNPDYAAVVIHNYRWRLSLADGERRYDALEKRLAARPTIGVPTITLDPERDPFTAPGGGASYRTGSPARTNTGPCRVSATTSPRKHPPPSPGRHRRGRILTPRLTAPAHRLDR